jgi:D-alanyl-lipoteichoic acid acyltransferase DltB (MBOAT superfamily)
MENFLESIDTSLIKDILLFDKDSPLLFNTGLFLLLFVGFLLIYQALRRWKNIKLVFVILFSLYFYYKSSAEYCLILLGVCISDYVIGRLMGICSRKWLKGVLVAVNVLSNVSMLIYFKYFNLLMETFAQITDTHFDPLNIVLPAGISFFTFRSISYIVDIYRGEIEPAKNFLEYTFFLTFFPPLLAGPVVRAKDMLPQIKENAPATHAMVSEGLFLIMIGLIKKVIIADYISGNFVDRIFDNPSLYSGFENVMGALGFTLQLYCDFSGYSDMAIGIALLLGYRFKANFASPYKSQNSTEFWHRWHISLSTWLRDYVYIPLGGNRHGKLRQYFNLFATMVIGGLWHGASWMYVIWGAYHGLLLVFHKMFTRLIHLPSKLKGLSIIKGFNILITFFLVVIGMMCFRSTSLENLNQMLIQVIYHFNINVAEQFLNGYVTIVAVMVIGYALHFMPNKWTRGVLKGYTASPFIVQSIILAIVIFAVIQTRQSDLVPFIYLKY